MDTPVQRNIIPARRALQAIAALAVVIALVFAVSPSAQAMASGWIRQIGAFFYYPKDASPLENQPTAVPASQQVRQAANGAEAAKIAGFDVLSVGNLPDGYAQDGAWGIFPQGEGVIVVSHYVDADGHFLTVNQYRYGPHDRYDDSSENSQAAIVRGHPGVWITGRLFEKGPGDRVETSWLVWEENGVNYTLMADALGYEDMLKVAEGLGK